MKISFSLNCCKTSIKSMAFIIHFLTLGLCLLQLSSAQECRNVASVTTSTTSLQQNVNKGGHVWQHIGGLTSGTKPHGTSPRDTQYKKTLFLSETKFKDAFAKLKALPSSAYPFVTCPTSGGTKPIADSVRASDVGITQAEKCNAVNTDNVCTSSTKYSMTGKNVIFCYKYYYGQWIMRTSYPRERKLSWLAEIEQDSCDDAFADLEDEELSYIQWFLSLLS